MKRTDTSRRLNFAAALDLLPVQLRHGRHDLPIAPMDKSVSFPGVSLPRARKVVVSVLLDADEFLDALQIHERGLDIDPRLSRGTVYRTLSMLMKRRIVLQLEAGHGKARYKLVSDKNYGHIVDIQTNKVTDILDSDIREAITQACLKQGFDVLHYSLVVKGAPRSDAGG